MTSARLFAHRLALALGIPDVDGMLARMSARQFAEWEAYYAQEPWGELRADLRAGIVASTLANVHRRARTPAFSPQDFMPYAPRAPIAEDEIERRIATFMTRYTLH